MELFDYASKNLPSKAEEFSLPPQFYMNPEEDEDESPASPPNSTSSNEDAKVESICTPCGKGFKTNQAMNDHMRIHEDRRGSKYNVVESLKAGPNRLRWGATRKFVWKQTLDKHGPEAVVAAFTLMELSRSKSYIDSSDQMNKKRKTMESDSLDLDEKKRMHDASENCNTSFPSDQALVEHPSSQKKSPKRKRKVNVKVKSESESHSHPQPHVCEICNESYATGQQLGGHKRAHYKKDPISEEVQKSPDPKRKRERERERERERKRKVKSESGSHSHVCEVCNKSYPTGHQLGGHMRAHQKKDPTPINEQVPNGGEAAPDDLADHMAQNAVNELALDSIKP